MYFEFEFIDCFFPKPPIFFESILIPLNFNGSPANMSFDLRRILFKFRMKSWCRCSVPGLGCIWVWYQAFFIRWWWKSFHIVHFAPRISRSLVSLSLCSNWINVTKWKYYTECMYNKIHKYFTLYIHKRCVVAFCVLLRKSIYATVLFSGCFCWRVGMVCIGKVFFVLFKYIPKKREKNKMEWIDMITRATTQTTCGTKSSNKMIVMVNKWNGRHQKFHPFSIVCSIC